MNTAICSMLTAGALLLAAGAAQAGTINGDFETGDFTGWTTTGFTSIKGAAYGTGPASGAFNALLETGTSSDTTTGITDTALESFFGLTAGSLDTLAASLPNTFNIAAEGSGIKQSVTVSAGDELTFDFNFLTNETDPTNSNAAFGVNDFAFVVVGDLVFLADTFTPNAASATRFDRETGYGTFTYTFAAAGVYTLGIGIIDVGDPAVDSGLLIDNVSIRAVPLPPAAWMGLGMLGLIGLGRKLKRRRE